MEISAPRFAVATGWSVAQLPGLETLLGLPVQWSGNPGARIPRDSVVLAWGKKPSAHRAERFAELKNLPLWRIEDGFIRSIGFGDTEPPLSLVVDPVGIYYDAAQPSAVEPLIRAPLDQSEKARARALVAKWLAGRVSKYNRARESVDRLPRRFVLVVDQTRGDVSVKLGLSDETTFHAMLDAAVVENPEAEIVLKVHPEVFAGRKQGHFDLLEVAKNKRIRVLGEDSHPAAFLERAEAIYVVTSQMGLEGLLWEKPVHVFGMPFYAGWGLTQDRLRPAETLARRGPVSIEQLIYGALIRYPRYRHPETGNRCEPEELIDWMGLQRRMRERFPARIHARGFSAWKRPFVRAYFQGSQVMFLKKKEDTPTHATLAIWGRRTAGDAEQVIRIEDGFLRSVGLGADLVRPLSWVMDAHGIYYDSTSPSDLEILLQSTEFSADLRTRAARLRETIVSMNLTKYNVGTQRWTRPAGGKRVVLVPGQVESDASIQHGAPGIKTNLGLLQAARQANPEAHLIYKPHPDVIAGLRTRGAGETQAKSYCDEIILEASMGELLTQVDELHVLTSLAGFEALLRGKPVTCHGQPFYSGWGLTTDTEPHPRRKRVLMLDELVAGALILYPAYLSSKTGAFTTPERILEELAEWRQRGPSTLPPWRKALRWVLRFRAK